jgi:hypothetical protein
VDSADAAPTSQAAHAADETLAHLETVLEEWEKTKH